MYNRCCLWSRMDAYFERKSFCSVLRYFGEYLRALISKMMKKLKTKCKALCDSRSCLGCCMRSPPVVSADKPSKGLKVPGQRFRKTSLRDDFWSSSACEMENSTFPSQGSISSISTSYQALDPHGNSSTTNNTSEFVNHGLLLWNQTRQQWWGKKSPQKHASVREPKLSFDASYETLLGNNKPFPQAIPLPEMVNFLVDVWEQEGLYD